MLFEKRTKKTLAVCRQLRNKILHCNFRLARDKLGELGFESRRGGVRKIDVQDLSGRQIAEKITRVVANIEGTYEYVSDTDTTDPGNVYGWLMEMGSAGEFRQAIDAFKKAAEIIDGLVANTFGTIGA